MNRGYNPDIHRRKSIRLDGYDYSQAGSYFVTIVTQDRLCLFGEVAEGEMRLNEAGEMVRIAWETLPGRFPSIGIDAFVVMPNHIHGIIVIHHVGASLVGAHSDIRATTRVAPTLGDVVGAYKSLTTLEYGKGVRDMDWPSFNTRLWQRNYYERVIRDDEEWNRVQEYIADNPVQWEMDMENPNAAPTEVSP